MGTLAMPADPSAISEAKQQPLSHTCIVLTLWLLSLKMRFLHSLKLTQNVRDTHSGSTEPHFLFCLGIFQLLQLIQKMLQNKFLYGIQSSPRAPFSNVFGLYSHSFYFPEKKQGQWTHWESHIYFNSSWLEAPQPKSTVKKFWKALEDVRLNH